MSQTTKKLKEIASGEEYEALASAVERVDYEAIFHSFVRIGELLKQGRRAIEQGIDNLTVQNKEEHRSKFIRAFELATGRILPLWYELNQQVNSGLAAGNTVEGEVFGFGRKGDPLVRTPEGTIVVLAGSKLEKGERARFRIVQETETLSFGRVFNLNPQSFYLLITQEARDKVEDSLGRIGDRLKTVQEHWNEDSSCDVGELLRELETVKELSPKLRAEDSRRVAAQVSNYRRKLLHDVGMRLMFDFISEQEERDIENFYEDGQDEKTKALLALGLFRRHTFEAAREGLLFKDEPDGYAEILDEMNDRVDSMHSAMEVLEFKSAVDEVYPRAKRYLEKMDRLFASLGERLKQVTEALSNKGVVEAEEVHQAITDAFSEKVLFQEFRRAFRNSSDFLSSRGAFMELNRRLNNQEATSAEVAFKPYLQHKVLQIFGPGKPNQTV